MLAAMRKLHLLSSASLIAYAVIVVWGCQDDDPNDQLTTASVGGTSTNGGMGGMPGVGGNGGNPGGMGGNPTAGGNPTGMGGQGGAPEAPIHGCLSTTAINNTGMSTVDLGYPIAPSNWPLCIRVSLNTVVSLGNDGSAAVGEMLVVGGTYDGAIKGYDAQSPIQPTCAVCPMGQGCSFDPNANGCYSGGTWTFGLAGVYPFYDNTAPGAPDNHVGVVYVVP
jgi:hypothetical protein